MMHSHNPLLRGITVLDLTRLLPGPYCSQQLAHLGATVIKVEEPNGGDYARSLAPELFELVNRGKQSLCLDLRLTDDVERFKQLVKTADVVIESFRPGVMAKFGCDYHSLKAVNPALVYASITGYGQTGPYKHHAGHDMNYLATAGVLEQIGPADGPPALSNVQIADLAAGAMNAAIGILAAVIGAKQSGHGEWVDISMTDGALAMNTVALAAINQDGKSPARGNHMLSGRLPNYRIYKCRDGRYLAVGALEPQFFMRVLSGIWESVPKALRQPLMRLAKAAPKNRQASSASNKHAQLAQLSQLLNHPLKGKLILKPLHWAMRAAFLSKSRDEWEQWFADKDACVSAVLTPAEALQHPLFASRHMVTSEHGKTVLNNPIKFQQPTPALSPSPALGEHKS